MDQKIHELRRNILRFLDERVLVKSKEQRTELDELVLQSGRAFTDALVRCERGTDGGYKTGAEDPFLALAKGYNAINYDRARRDKDAEAMAMFRDPSDE